jgi:hypothetical protein
MVTNESGTNLSTRLVNVICSSRKNQIHSIEITDDKNFVKQI